MNEKFQDPHEMAKCACPRLDARDCARVRSGRHLMDDLEYWVSSDWDDECDCVCHFYYEEQLRDEETDEEREP